MDNQAYLNQISAAARPTKKQNAFFSSPLMKVLVGGVALLVVLMIVVSIFGGGNGGLKDKCIELKLRLDSTAELISTYQPNVKSPKLRSESASLASVISDTNLRLTEYMTAKFGYKEKDIDKKVKSQITAIQEESNEELFKAKINGILDRIYAHKMASEISYFTAQESSISNSTSDETLKNILNTFHNSLNNLYDNFNDFSETK